MARRRDPDRDEEATAERGPHPREGYLLWLDPTTEARPALRGEIERARTADRRRFRSEAGLLRTLRALAGVPVPERAEVDPASRTSTPDSTTPKPQEDER